MNTTGLTEAVARLKTLMDSLDEIKVKRSVMLQKHAREIGEHDNAINQLWTKISSLISCLDAIQFSKDQAETAND